MDQNKIKNISFAGFTDIEIAYTDAGEGPLTLLFLHGLGSNRKVWYKNIPYLKKYARCIAIDLPNYGESSRGDYPCTMSFFSEVTLAFITQMELKEVVLVGHSMGGQISLTTALSYPTRLHALVLIAPAGFEIFNELEKQWFRTFYTPVLLRAQTKEQTRKNFELNFFEVPEDANFMLEDRFKLETNTEDFQYYSETIPKCVLSMLEESVHHRLDEISLPTTIFFGENDLLIPNKIFHQTLETTDVAHYGHGKIKNSQLHILPECGHFVQVEKASFINQKIVKALSLSSEGAVFNPVECTHSFLKALSEKSFDALNYLHSDYRCSDPLLLELSRSDIEKSFHFFFKPDSAWRSFSFENVILDGDKTNTYWILHLRKASGRQVSIEGQSTFTFRDGKIIQQYNQYKGGEAAFQWFGLKGWLIALNQKGKHKLRQMIGI